MAQKGPSNIALSKIGKIKTFQQIWQSQWQYQAYIFSIYQRLKQQQLQIVWHIIIIYTYIIIQYF